MNFKEYGEYVETLASSQSTASFRDRLLTAALGLAGEAGECADIVKKHVYHGKEFDRDKFIDEMSDVLWYLTFGCNAASITVDELMEYNVQKLNARYKTGKFTHKEFMQKEIKKEQDDLAPDNLLNSEDN